jgi:hypothetical protein
MLAKAAASPVVSLAISPAFLVGAGRLFLTAGGNSSAMTHLDAYW